MASVKRQWPGGPWYLCYKVPTGETGPNGKPLYKRVQKKSAWVTDDDKRNAETAAKDYEHLAVLAAEKQLNDTEVRRFLNHMALISKVTLADTISTRKHLERWLESQGNFVATKTRVNYKGVINDFLRYAEGNQAAVLARCTHTVLTDFRDAEVNLGKSAATINKALSILGKSFEGAVIAGILPINPARGLRVKKLATKGKTQKRQPFSFAQFRQLALESHFSCWRTRRISSSISPHF